MPTTAPAISGPMKPAVGIGRARDQENRRPPRRSPAHKAPGHAHHGRLRDLVELAVIGEMDHQERRRPMTVSTTPHGLRHHDGLRLPTVARPRYWPSRRAPGRRGSRRKRSFGPILPPPRSGNTEAAAQTAIDSSAAPTISGSSLTRVSTNRAGELNADGRADDELRARTQPAARRPREKPASPRAAVAMSGPSTKGQRHANENARLQPTPAPERQDAEQPDERPHGALAGDAETASSKPRPMWRSVAGGGLGGGRADRDQDETCACSDCGIEHYPRPREASIRNRTPRTARDGGQNDDGGEEFIARRNRQGHAGRRGLTGPARHV